MKLTHLVISSLLTCALLTAANAQAADRYTIRAPIDGFISVLPPKGSVHPPSPPPVSEYLARLITSLQVNGLKAATTAAEPEPYDFARLNTGSNASFIRNPAARADLGKAAIHLPGIGDIRLAGMDTAQLDKVLQNTAKSAPVIVIHSPVTEYQLLEARQTLLAAQLSLGIANARLAKENGGETREDCDKAKGTKGWRCIQQQQISANSSYKKVSRDAEAAGNKHHGADLKTAGEKEASLTQALDSERLDFHVDTDLLGKARIAEAQVQSALGVVQSIDAALLQGQITCPKKCKIISVYAYPTQPVTRGDPLVDVQFLE